MLDSCLRCGATWISLCCVNWDWVKRWKASRSRFNFFFLFNTKHRTAVIQTTKQKQTRIDTWTDWCPKHRQYKEGRELDVTRTKDVSCRGHRESRLSPDFPSVPERAPKSIFLLSWSLSLSHVICISSPTPPPFFFTLLFFYFILLSPTPPAWCSSWLWTYACLEFSNPIFHCQPIHSWSQRWAITDSV